MINWSKKRTAAEVEAEAAASLQAAVTAAIDAHVEATAKARGYNGASSLAGYATSTIPVWAAEAVAFIAWRDGVWTAAFTMLAEVQAQERAAPTPSEAVAELPAMVWPS